MDRGAWWATVQRISESDATRQLTLSEKKRMELMTLQRVKTSTLIDYGDFKSGMGIHRIIFKYLKICNLISF